MPINNYNSSFKFDTLKPNKQLPTCDVVLFCFYYLRLQAVDILHYIFMAYSSLEYNFIFILMTALCSVIISIDISFCRFSSKNACTHTCLFVTFHISALPPMFAAFIQKLQKILFFYDTRQRDGQDIRLVVSNTPGHKRCCTRKTLQLRPSPLDIS